MDIERLKAIAAGTAEHSNSGAQHYSSAVVYEGLGQGVLATIVAALEGPVLEQVKEGASTFSHLAGQIKEARHYVEAAKAGSDAIGDASNLPISAGQIAINVMYQYHQSPESQRSYTTADTINDCLMGILLLAEKLKEVQGDAAHIITTVSTMGRHAENARDAMQEGLNNW